MTDPSDPMDKLARALKAAPAPRGKAAALNAALSAFDEEFEAASQETPTKARQRPQRQPIWSRLMSFATRNLRPALMGGASLAALSLAVFVAVDRGGDPVRYFMDTSAFREDDAAPRAEAPDGAAILQGAVPQGRKPDAAAIARERSLADAVIAAQQPEVGELIVPTPQAAPARPPSPTTRVQRGPVKGAKNVVIADTITKRAAPAPLHSSENLTVLQSQALRRSSDAVRIEPPARDRFAAADANPVKLVTDAPVSTFSVDVDTAAYAWVRRSLRDGRLPDPASVRVEEMVNYFAYDYAQPASAERPFSVATSLTAAPWAEGRQILRVGLRGFEPEAPPRMNYTFLVDTSGSMNREDKLPLLLTSLRLLLDGLSPDDTVALVTYAGSSTIALEPTRAAERGKILDALDRLQAGGGTAGAAGIETAYRLAEDRYDAEAVNRVILATDGDFNIGAVSPGEMKALIERKRDSGVFLSVLGFGRGNLNDELMQTLAQAGNGQAAYIDTLAEARKALVEERRAMTPIAKDVKIQIEFNPAAVQDYRLIGYETRALAREDFNNDKVDAGEIGAGHRVTALYEITPVGGPARIDALRYQSPAAATGAASDSARGDASELAYLRLRWKAPDSDVSKLSEVAIPAEVVAPDQETRFAAAVAGFAERLRGARHIGDWSYDDALNLAAGARGEDPFGHRSEFLDLIRLARSLDR
ncbi:MAG: von Willebrand factor type A domain-containing protein [Pseudomonadota bacterium]